MMTLILRFIVSLLLISRARCTFSDLVLNPLNKFDGETSFLTSADTLDSYYGIRIDQANFSKLFNKITHYHDSGVPLIFTDLDKNQTIALSNVLPFMGFGLDGSSILLVDAVEDLVGAKHYFSFHLGSNDVQAMETHDDIEYHAQNVRIHLDSYLIYCGGLNPDKEECWNYIRLMTNGDNQTSFNSFRIQNAIYRDKEGYGESLEPPEGAVWRLFVQTSYMFWIASSIEQNFEFDNQTVSHFTTYSCYVYLQAEPESYFIFLNARSSHESKPKIEMVDSLGFYLSDVKLFLNAAIGDENLKIIRRSPHTFENKKFYDPVTVKTFFKEEIDLAYRAYVSSEGLVITDADAWEAVFADERFITQWSVALDRSKNYQGIWTYYQEFPVNTIVSNITAYPEKWEDYFQIIDHPCLVRDASVTASDLIETAISSVWIVDASKRSSDGRKLVVDLDVGLEASVVGVTCKNDKSVISSQSSFARRWSLNIADLNNIRK